MLQCHRINTPRRTNWLNISFLAKKMPPKLQPMYVQPMFTTWAALTSYLFADKLELKWRPKWLHISNPRCAANLFFLFFNRCKQGEEQHAEVQSIVASFEGWPNDQQLVMKIFKRAAFDRKFPPRRMKRSVSVQDDCTLSVENLVFCRDASTRRSRSR